MSRYQSWKTCPDTRAGKQVRTPELEDMSLITRPERYVWLPELEDMSGYQSNSTRTGAAFAFGSPFLSLLYPYHRQEIEGLLPKDYPAIVECCQWLLRQCAQNPLYTSLMIYSGWYKEVTS
jgi:hypothetical protein